MSYSERLRALESGAACRWMSQQPDSIGFMAAKRLSELASALEAVPAAKLMPAAAAVLKRSRRDMDNMGVFLTQSDWSGSFVRLPRSSSVCFVLSFAFRKLLYFATIRQKCEIQRSSLLRQDGLSQ